MDSPFCRGWIQPKLSSLQESGPAPGRFATAHYREGCRIKLDEVSWTKLISEHTKRGQGKEALRLYKDMLEQGVKPTTHSFVAALKACSKSRNLRAGKKIHSQVMESGMESDLFVGSTLVDMYLKCGSTSEARAFFDRMTARNVVSWNAMILGYAQRDEGEPALQLYACMQQEGVSPNARTFVAALKACASLAAQEDGVEVGGKLVKIGCLQRGKVIHSHVLKSGLEADTFVASTLVDMYARCGNMEEARAVFERTPRCDVVSWTAMILGYAQRDEGELALQLYAQMQQEGFSSDARTFVAALRACASLAEQEVAKDIGGTLIKCGCLEKGRAIHAHVVESKFESDVFVASTLVDMYAKCGSMAEACAVFEGMPFRNALSWAALIQGYAHSNKGELALQIYARMLQEGVAPNARTVVAALKACASLAVLEGGQIVDGTLLKIGSLEKGRAIHSQVINIGVESDIFVASILVDMYAKCRSLVEARMVFDRMECRNVVSWTAMILGYAQMGKGELALHLYSRMQQEGVAPNSRTFVGALNACSSLAEQEAGKEVDGIHMKAGCLEKGRAIHSHVAKNGLESDKFVGSALVDMYAKCGSMVDARAVFERMLYRDVVQWNAMILGYAQSDEGELALEFYGRMLQEGFSPDGGSFVGVLKACGSIADLESGKKVHAEIMKARLESDVIVATCLVDMYGKCGSMVDSQQVFDALPVRDLVPWTALIAGYSRQGNSQRVFDLFLAMKEEGIQPSAITFLCVLTVCSHAGLVTTGQHYFQSMTSDYGIKPTIEHYGCMVDLLGRAGHVDEALAVVEKMPFQPDMVTWMTVLGACRKWNVVEVGRRAFESAVLLDKHYPPTYLMMSNIYAAAGMLEESAKIQEMRRHVRAWKRTPGRCWWIDDTGMVHKFSVGDTRHPQSKDIYVKLKDLVTTMRGKGYVPNLDCVLSNITDDEKEDALCGHSERLAIACALINTPSGTPIRIAKNLRVCDDCHEATEVISKIEQRTIICRDANRFHVYSDGKCNCGGFW